MSQASPTSAENDSPSADIHQAGASCWRVIGAAATGISHQRNEIPCQDFHAHRILSYGGGQALLIALADGAGSAEHAERGARQAVAAALDELESGLRMTEAAPLDYEMILHQAFAAAQQALCSLAEEDDLPVRSLATTLTCVVAADGFLTVGQVGDGTVVVKTDQGEFLAVTQLQRGEYANETVFLTQQGALELLEIQVLHQPIQALAVLSDGLMRLALNIPANQPHGPFFNPLFTFTAASQDPQLASEQLAAFLRSERVSARTDDDKSLVLAVYGEAPAGEPNEGMAGE